jgi:hypothetical protein
MLLMVCSIINQILHASWCKKLTNLRIRRFSHLLYSNQTLRIVWFYFGSTFFSFRLLFNWLLLFWLLLLGLLWWRYRAITWQRFLWKWGRNWLWFLSLKFFRWYFIEDKVEFWSKLREVLKNKTSIFAIILS